LGQVRSQSIRHPNNKRRNTRKQNEAMHKLIRSSQQQASLKPLERILLNEAQVCVYLRRKHRPLQGGIGQTGGEALGIGGFAGVVQFVNWLFGNGRGRRKARGRRGSNKIDAKRHGKKKKKLSLEVVHQFMTDGNERDTAPVSIHPLNHSIVPSHRIPGPSRQPCPPRPTAGQTLL